MVDGRGWRVSICAEQMAARSCSRASAHIRVGGTRRRTFSPTSAWSGSVAGRMETRSAVSLAAPSRVCTATLDASIVRLEVWIRFVPLGTTTVTCTVASHCLCIIACAIPEARILDISCLPINCMQCPRFGEVTCSRRSAAAMQLHAGLYAMGRIEPGSSTRAAPLV
jgi:hypothetical protein